MSKNLKKYAFGAVAIGMTMMPLAALALDPVVPPTDLGPVVVPNDPNDIGSAQGFIDTLVIILGYVQAVFWIAAVFFGLYAAFLYLTARGDAEKISRANHMLIYVVIAAVVAIISYSIPAFVQGTLTGN